MTTEIGIATSHNSDGSFAAKEVAMSIKSQMQGNPSFILVFTTIHYKQQLNSMLKIISSEFQSKTPLIGGTMPGFITNDGVFTRGIAIAAYKSDEIAVFPVHGSHTKRNPEKAAEEIINQIFANSELISKYPTKILIEFVSGPTVPQFPILKRKKVIKNKTLGGVLSTFEGLFLKIFENGVGREDEVLEHLSSKLKDWKIIGGSTLDDNNLSDNLQFFGEQTMRNSIVGMVILSKKEHRMKTTYGLQESGKDIKLELNPNNNRIITKIDSLPAVQGLLKKTGWFEDTLDERLYRKTFHYTIGFKRNGILYPEVIGACYGTDIWVGYNISDTDAQILTATGSKILEAIKTNLDSQIKSDTDFFFITSCASILETLGRKNYLLKEVLDQKFLNKKYLVLYVGGEDTYSAEHGCRHINYSFNSIVLDS